MGIEPSVIAKMQGAGERGCKVMLCGPKHIFELVVCMFFKSTSLHVVAENRLRF